MTNTNLLKAKIIEKGLNQMKLSKKMGISCQALNSKINNKSEFTAKEIYKISEILQITSEKDAYFFCELIAKTANY